MSAAKLVLVSGATGQQGGAVARSLLAKGHRVRGITRNIESAAAKSLADQGVEVVTANFTDEQSLVDAAAGVDAFFAMTTPFEGGVEEEARQGKILVDAAVSAGVGHVVYSSVASADRNTNIPHFDSKYAVERQLAATDLTWSVIAPVFFMENLFLEQTLDGIRNGTYAAPLPPDVMLQQVAVADIGAFAAHVIANCDDFAGRRVDIAGDELTSAQATEELTKVLGRPITFFEIPMDQIRAFSEDFALMYEWFIDTGYTADIAGLRDSYPEVGWQRFVDWGRDAVPAAV